MTRRGTPFLLERDAEAIAVKKRIKELEVELLEVVSKWEVSEMDEPGWAGGEARKVWREMGRLGIELRQQRLRFKALQNQVDRRT